MLELNHTLCVLDDDSNDRTHEILEQLSSGNPKIITVNKTNTEQGQTCIYDYQKALENKGAILNI